MRSLRIVPVALATLFAAGTGGAQPAAPPAAPSPLVSVTTLTVRSSALSEFEEYAKKVNQAAIKTGVKPANFYSVGRGGPGFTYLATVRYGSWAEMDARPSVPAMLVRAFGEAEGGKIFRTGTATIESLSTVVLRVLPSVSTPPASLDPPAAHVRISRIEVNPGTGGKLETYLGKLKAAQDKVGGTPPVIRYAAALGPQNVYSVAYFFDKYAQWDSAPSIPDVLKKAYGEGEAALLDETSRSCIRSLEAWVLDYRADLSRP
ncbi:MAG TPA: hypothetical protein PLB02_12145 [Thermoanaerobaculia bacterium]|nr:hypothetical protein [Thermoanaerobaculia bacterium]HQR68136.1 hypothetical protein [Thermoanaerobaculia bacterium]